MPIIPSLRPCNPSLFDAGCGTGYAGGYECPPAEPPLVAVQPPRLLVFVTLCALACSWLAVKLRETQREEAAAAAIEKVGGTAAWDAKLSGPAWLRSLLGEHVFGNVTNVVLHGDKLSDTALEPLYSLNHLQRLDLSFANITDADIEHLQGYASSKGFSLKPRR